LNVGLTVDSDLVPDVDLLAQALVDELDLQDSLLKPVKTKRRIPNRPASSGEM
jgi:hypothetical protein